MIIFFFTFQMLNVKCEIEWSPFNCLSIVNIYFKNPYIYIYIYSKVGQYMYLFELTKKKKQKNKKKKDFHHSMNSAGAFHGKIALLPGKLMSYNCHYCST